MAEIEALASWAAAGSPKVDSLAEKLTRLASIAGAVAADIGERFDALAADNARLEGAAEYLFTRAGNLD